MISNRTKKNIWLALAVLSLVAVIDLAIRVADGSVEWWNLVSVIIITFFCTRFYFCYRRQVKIGNLFGRVKKF